MRDFNHLVIEVKAFRFLKRNFNRRRKYITLLRKEQRYEKLENIF
jgi:hypothetical protein